MCLLCVISNWSRRIATMLPWIVIPFIIIWALSQLFPPTYRLEVTSPRIACVGVLLGSLGWYEVIMPSLSMWRARRSALLRERKLIEVQEAAKLRKEATRRCRNCLTVYKVQSSGSGRYMCTYCGHVSKRPVLEVPGMLMGPINSGSSSKVHSDVQFMNKDGMLYLGRGHTSVKENMRTGCSIGDGWHCFLDIMLRVLSMIGRALKHLFRFGRSESADTPKGPYQRKDNTDNLHVSKAEKARKKADERRQARLVKELVEAEERKQREEVAHMVEERRRHREEEVQIEKESEMEAAAEREREIKRTRESERRHRDKDKGRIRETPCAEEVSTSTGVVDNKEVHQTACTPKLLDISREARSVYHDRGLRNRAGIDRFTNPGLQRYLGSAKRSSFSTSKKDFLWRGKRDAPHSTDKSMTNGASVASSGTSSNSNTFNISTSSVSAWKKPLFNAWSKSMETSSSDDTKRGTRTVPDESGKPEQDKTSGVMSWTSNTSAVKSLVAPVGSTCMQPPIARPSTHIASLHQLFSSPSIFPPIDLSMDFQNQHENDSVTELKTSFISDHTFFENAACISFQSPISLAEQDLFPSTATTNLENMDTRGVLPTLPPQVSNPESLLQIHMHDPQWKLPILHEDIVDNSGDSEAKQNEWNSLEVDEMMLSKLLTWVPDTVEKEDVHLPHLSTLQSLFENETFLPEEEGPFSSPLKDVFQKGGNDDGLASPQLSSEKIFSDYLAFNRALQIWEDGDSPQKLPPEFVDCITQEVMKDPVITADGHSYERAAIEKWLMYHDTSPKTGEVLPPPPGMTGMDKMAVDKTLRPNHILRGQIIEYKERVLKMASRASEHDN